jgi:hypothetical protein
MVSTVPTKFAMALGLDRVGYLECSAVLDLVGYRWLIGGSVLWGKVLGAGDGTLGDGGSTLGEGGSTLGDGGSTLGDGDSTVGDGDSAGGSGLARRGVVACGWTVVLKMSASLRNATVCASPSVVKGPWGSLFSKAWIKSFAAKIAASVWLIVGTLQVAGKNSVVSEVRVPLVCGK